VHTTIQPANGLGSNKFNRLDFVVGLPKLDAIGPTLLIIRFGLGSTPYQFGVGVVWGSTKQFQMGYNPWIVYRGLLWIV
jgi:hypothetical protein